MDAASAVSAVIGLLSQGIRASGIPSYWMYPATLVGAVLCQLVWGTDHGVNQLFWQHALDSWLIALGVNRVTSDLAHGTPLQTRDQEAPKP